MNAVSHQSHNSVDCGHRKDIDLETFMTKMLPEMAAEALAKKGGKKKEHSDPAVQEKLAQFKSKMAAKCKEWESAPTVSSSTACLPSSSFHSFFSSFRSSSCYF